MISDGEDAHDGGRRREEGDDSRSEAGWVQDVDQAVLQGRRICERRSEGDVQDLMTD